MNESGNTPIESQSGVPRLEAALPSGNALLPLDNRVPGSMAPKSPPPVLSSTPNFQGLLIAFKQRWLLACSLGALLAVTVAVPIWLFWPLKYVARAQLRVFDKHPIIITETPESRTDFANYQRTQLAMIRSRLVLNKALNEKGIADLKVVRESLDPVEWLEKQVEANFARAPEILEITMSGNDPDALKRLVNAVRDAYVREVVESELRLRRNRFEQLKKLYGDHDSILREKQKVFRSMAEDLGSRDSKLLAQRQHFAYTELHNLQGELFALHSKVRAAKLEMEMDQIREKEIDNIKVPESVLEEAVKQDVLIVRYVKDIDQIKDDMRRLKRVSNAPDEVPAYRDGPKKIAELEEKLKARKVEVLPLLTSQAKAKFVQDAMARRQEAQEKLALFAKHEETLQQELKSKDEQTQQFGKRTNNLEWLRDEIAQVDEMTKRIYGQMAPLEIELQAPSRVKVLDEEAVVGRPADKKVMMCGMGGLGAFGVVVLGISWLEFRKRKVTDGSEIAQGLKINLLGSVPHLSNKSSEGFYEAIDSTRTMLLHSPAFECSQVIMITSAVGGEGKTFLSSHLSVSLARTGSRTLLVDCDLRRSSIKKLFGLNNEGGLSEVLRGEGDVASLAQVGPVDGLWILCAGHADARALQALNNRDAVSGLLAGLRRQYDHIVIDSAPVLPVADSQVIARHVDGVIMSVIRSVSHLNLVYQAYEKLTALRCRIFGAVVHGVSGGIYGAKYSYAAAPAEAKK